jgi:hypothetical protein
LTVRVRACDQSGIAIANTSVSVRVARRPVPPLQRAKHVRARRSGKRAVVTWRTDRPARRQEFIVLATNDRHADFGSAYGGTTAAFAAGNGRRSFKARVPADGMRYVAIFTIAEDPPFRSRTTSVRIRG